MDNIRESRCSTGDGVVVLDVSWLVPADLAAVDALARLHVVASRRGWRLQLHGADGGLAELIALVGLAEIVCVWPDGHTTGHGGPP